jgi:ubiquinone/menaquinone biosynthesis C-methylase UbiE
MVQLARTNAEKVGAQNVRFRLGEIEDIPFRDEQFDAVISNCVINLSPDKPQVFREAFRVLAPGGRLRVSDMVLTKELPEEQRHDLEQWAGCVAGALRVEQYLGAIRDAGFIDVSAEYEDDGNRGIASAYVSAVRPS